MARQSESFLNGSLPLQTLCLTQPRLDELYNRLMHSAIIEEGRQWEGNPFPDNQGEGRLLSTQLIVGLIGPAGSWVA